MQSRDNICFTCWLDVSLNAFPKLLFDWSERACGKIPTVLREVNKDRRKMQQTAHCYYGETTARVDSLHLLTTPSLSATCHAKLQTVNKHFLIPYCTAQLTTAAGLVQKCAVLFAVVSVWGRIMFSPQTNRYRVRSKAYRDHLLLLVRTRVRLLHSYLPKRTAPRGKTNSSAIQRN